VSWFATWEAALVLRGYLYPDSGLAETEPIWKQDGGDFIRKGERRRMNEIHWKVMEKIKLRRESH
jgi:hypothetical protein